MTTKVTGFDQDKKDAFAGRMMGILNDGMLAVMISVGHRTGLFDAMATLPAATSHEIAERAGLQERYVRECLGALVTGQIVTYDPGTRAYRLPREHAPLLTRAGGAENIATFVRFLPHVAKVEDQIVECFRQGGGVPYSEYTGFSEAMHEASSPMFDGALLDEVLPLVPELRGKLEEGSEVLEVGCGSGHALMLLARHFANSRFVGYDLIEDSVAMGVAKAEAEGLENVSFEKRDVTTMTHDGHFDVVTAFDTVHDQAKPDVLLAGIARALKPGGIYLMSDVKASTFLENNLEHTARSLLLLGLVHALHVRFAGAGRHGPGRRVGRGEGQGDDQGGGTPARRRQADRDRSVQQLLHCPETLSVRSRPVR